MKWLLRIFGVLIALLLIVAVLAFLYLETVVVDKAEEIATRELGVPVTMGVMTIGWMDKTITLRNIKIANPQGFKTDYFLKIPTISVQVSNKILSNPLVVDSIRIDGLTAFYEVNAKGSNVKNIQNNLQKSASSSAKATNSQKQDSKKEFIIEDLRISNAVLTPAVSLAGQNINQSVNIPVIHLRNIGSQTNPASARQIVLRVVSSLMGSIQNSAVPKLVINNAVDEVNKQMNKASDAIGGALNNLFGQ